MFSIVGVSFEVIFNSVWIAMQISEPYTLKKWQSSIFIEYIFAVASMTLWFYCFSFCFRSLWRTKRIESIRAVSDGETARQLPMREKKKRLNMKAMKIAPNFFLSHTLFMRFVLVRWLFCCIWITCYMWKINKYGSINRVLYKS